MASVQAHGKPPVRGHLRRLGQVAISAESIPWPNRIPLNIQKGEHEAEKVRAEVEKARRQASESRDKNRPISFMA